jgi:hypothetical protein
MRVIPERIEQLDVTMKEVDDMDDEAVTQRGEALLRQLMEPSRSSIFPLESERDMRRDGVDSDRSLHGRQVDETESGNGSDADE